MTTVPRNVAAALYRLGAYVMGDDGAESDLAAVEEYIASTANKPASDEDRCADGYCAWQPACSRGRCIRAERAFDEKVAIALEAREAMAKHREGRPLAFPADPKRQARDRDA